MATLRERRKTEEIIYLITSSLSLHLQKSCKYSSFNTIIYIIKLQLVIANALQKKFGCENFFA
jgi:hypothetical protein